MICNLGREPDRSSLRIGYGEKQGEHRNPSVVLQAHRLQDFREEPTKAFVNKLLNRIDICHALMIRFHLAEKIGPIGSFIP
jgi:hypothetical protein